MPGEYHLLTGSLDIKGMWSPMGGRIVGAGPTGITPGGGATTDIMGVSPMLGACIIPECGGPRGLEPEFTLELSSCVPPSIKEREGCLAFFFRLVLNIHIAPQMRFQVAAYFKLNHLSHVFELGQHIMVEIQELLSIASADMDFNQLEAFLTAQTKKQGGITSEQAAVISKFWKSHKTKIRESLMNQSRWDNGLRGLSWRVDGKSQSRHSTQIHSPVAIIELEFGKSGQESEFLCLEFDEVKVKQILKKLSEVEESIHRLMQAA
ncbi:COMM domain-containing protein 1 isoform X4 [Mastomys coucha]|uniref:COMM domain-containing protein 1 isoform X4 n=2 Tax=Mastomys coucha TaxID=35658 RepID=UPI0012628B36|nr:COMM domain-containing protein 1 isoform X4 [Mastomys coucha]